MSNVRIRAYSPILRQLGTIHFFFAFLLQKWLKWWINFQNTYISVIWNYFFEYFCFFVLSNIGYFHPLSPLKIIQMKQSEKSKCSQLIHTHLWPVDAGLFCPAVLGLYLALQNQTIHLEHFFKIKLYTYRGRGGLARPNIEQHNIVFEMVKLCKYW